MNKNYLTPTHTEAKKLSIRKSILSIALLFFISFAFAQQTATITTTRDGFFVFQIDNTGGALLKWEVSGAITIPSGTIPDSNNPTIDLTGSGGGVSTITITSTDDFASLIKLDIAGMDVEDFDLTNMNALQELRIGSNNLISVDISGNTNLTFLNAKNNNISSVDFANNAALTYVDLESNSLNAVDVSPLINVEHLDLEYNNINTINIDNNSKLTNFQIGYNPISNTTIDYILNKLDSFGLSNGILEVDPSFTVEGAYVTTAGIDAFRRLDKRYSGSKGWTIDLDPSIDYGDAPAGYNTVDPNGSSHLRVFKQEFWLGLLRDTENNGFPGANADGDDTNNVDDEDGVNPAEFDNISETTTTIDIDVQVLNNTTHNGELHAWIDFDRNGTFEPDEHVSVAVAPTPSPVPPSVKGTARKAALKRAITTFTLTWNNIGTTGPDVVPGPTYARFRFTSDPITANDPGGIVNAGEVEDYGFEILSDFDKDGIPDITDVDDDNDGILDTLEDNGTVDRDTDGDGNPDRIDLDADGDGCFDVDEAGFTNNGANMLGTANPPVVDATGKVTSTTDGYTAPNDLNGSGTPDFQEAGTAATITTQPVDQDLIIGDVTFSVVANADTYQWQESQDGGTTWNDLADGGDYAGTATANLVVTNSDISKLNYKYHVMVDYISFACAVPVTSAEAGYITPDDFDGDGIFDIVDVDDDNDGILDTVEDNGVADRDTDGDGMPDRIDWDADGDGCFDVDEAGFTNNGNNMLGTANPPVVDATGKVTSTTDGYTAPNDLDSNGTPDFQEAGAAATITTQPVDQNLIIGTSTFSVVATADTYQWEESQDGETTWAVLVDGGDYAGTTTADLVITNSDVSKLNYRYRVIASNIAFSCDPTVTSNTAGFVIPGDFDGDGIFDIVDVDDDNDGILDTVEDNGVADRDTDGDGMPDRIDWDADGDGCFDVDEAGFTNNGNNMLGTANPPVVDATGKVTSTTDGYTAPNDLDSNGTPDFQEAGAAATITTQPVDQNLIPTQTATFNVVATADTYQWEESTDGGTSWAPLTDGGNYSGTTTASLTVSNLDVAMNSNIYRVQVNNIAFACDPVTTSSTAGFISLPDFDGDNVPDIVDVDDDNDGILDTVEDNGVADRDTDGDGNPDRIDLDADGDGCFDVNEAGFTNNGANMLGTANPPVVDATGKVTSATDGYTTPNDLDGNGTPDFQEAGEVAAITTQPSDQDFNYGNTVTFSVVTTGDTYKWEESTDSGATWTALTEGGNYTGVDTNQLTVSNADINMYFNDYRVQVSNIAYACDSGTYSDVVSYNALLDTDGDGIFDVIDVDDDNDGILDTVEENGDPNRDTDGDGVLDRIDWDADGDGCPDVTEAGFTNNGNDMLGTKNPPDVDAEGKVTSTTDGYTTPNDLNNNGTPDFQEAGSPSSISSNPSDIEITLGDNAVFTVSGDATYYQWQVSTNNGSSWNDLTDDAQYSGTQTNTLTVIAARGRVESNLYRVVLRTPDYACDPNPELFSEAGKLMFNQLKIPNVFTPNGDGKNDVFSIPGLAQYPNFKMKVFDRWGNMVYHYENNGSSDPRWWDGHAKGSLVLSDGERVPSGTYFYLIEYNDGSTKPIKGWVYVTY